MFKTSLCDTEIEAIGEFVASKVLDSIRDVNFEVLGSIVKDQVSLALNTQEIVSGQASVIMALKTVNDKLRLTNEVLELHLQVATVRAGLEKSDQGVYDSLLLGLQHMRKRCKQQSIDVNAGPKREFEAVARKIDGLIKEFNFLRDKAQIDELIDQIAAITSVPSLKRERKRFEPG